MSTADLKYGLDFENMLYGKVKELFGDDTLQTSGSHPYDYYNSNTFIELKSRRCKHNRYPTTMIGENKLKFASKNPDKKFIFLFRFEDGLYQHIFNPEKEYNIKIGGRQDRGRPEFKKYCYIPITELTLLLPS